MNDINYNTVEYSHKTLFEIIIEPNLKFKVDKETLRHHSNTFNNCFDMCDNLHQSQYIIMEINNIVEFEFWLMIIHDKKVFRRKLRTLTVENLKNLITLLLFLQDNKTLDVVKSYLLYQSSYDSVQLLELFSLFNDDNDLFLNQIFNNLKPSRISNWKSSYFLNIGMDLTEKLLKFRPFSNELDISVC